MAALGIALLGGLVGGTIGYGFGYTALGVSIGWAIGSYVGQELYAPSYDRDIGPRLDDLTVQSSTYGLPIPDVFGAIGMAGNLIWSTGLIEVKEDSDNDSGGKKGSGGSDTEYKYFASFAVGLCEGPIEGIGRIWFDGKLWIDYTSTSTQQNRDNNKVTIHFGSESQAADSTIQSYEGAANTPAYRGLAYLVFNYVALANYGNHHPNVVAEVFKTATVSGDRYLYETQHYPTQASIITKLCTDVGLTSGQIDVTDLTDTLYGYARTSVTPSQSVVEQLLFAYLIDVAEVDKKLVFATRGKASIETITQADLSASSSNEILDKIISTTANEIELPSKLNIKFLHKGRKYEVGSQYHSYYFTNTVNEQIVDLPIAMSETEAIQIAIKLLAAVWSARTRYNFSTTSKYIYLTPSNVITVDGIKMRIVTMGMRDGLLLFECASEYDAGLFETDYETTEDDFDAEVVGQPGDTILHFLDCPAFNENGDNAGFYLAAYSTSTGWTGAYIYYSSDGGSTYSVIDSIDAAATIGVVQNTLGDQTAAGAIWDNKNTLTVQLSTPGKALYSTTEIAVLNGANAAVVGVPGRWEILNFVTVVDNGGDNYTLSDLSRGRRGSEHNMGNHATSDYFIMIDTTLARINLGSNNIGLQRIYRPDSIGNLDQGTPENFTLQAICLECYSVVHVTGSRDGSSNLTISWIRRDRIDGEWRDNTDISVSEINEYYEIDILDGASVVRTLSTWGTWGTSISYTAAEQTTDFGSAQSSIDVKIYQMSNVVGRGTVREATI